MSNLSTLFDEGLHYQTENAHWSAILAFHDFINGGPIGKHPKLCALLTGIFNEIPPQSRYTFIWDIDVVLNYKSKKDLTCKLTVLLTLSSVLRVSSIHHLNINFIATTKSCYKFYFNKPDKSLRKVKKPSVVIYKEYTQHDSLWVARTFDEYIVQRQKWEFGEEHSQLLLSFIYPHKPVVFNTISGWLTTIVMKSDVDIGTLKVIQTDLHQRLKQV